MPKSAQQKRRDLAPLRHLPRSVALNYLRRALDRPADQAPGGASRHLLKLLAVTLPAAVASYARHRLGPRHAFAEYGSGSDDQGIYPLTGDDQGVRLSIAGDWASGTDEAAAVAAAIASFRPHFTLHLGDVYYVGAESEVRATFFGERTCSYQPTLWPAGSVGSFALNGNHEMYARGNAYFDVLLPRLGFKGSSPQHASFFCLENPHWRVIALDTAYNSVRWPLLEELPIWPFAPSNDLTAAQLRWLARIIRPDADQRGLVILSHHAPYSRAGGCTRFARQLQSLVQRPVLWFFGHEHRLAVYDRFSGGGGLEIFGRNVGHAGMPVEPPWADRPARLLYTDTRRHPNEGGLEVGYNGYANLTFAGSALAIDYRDLSGESVYREEWRVAGGALQTVAGRA